MCPLGVLLAIQLLGLTDIGLSIKLEELADESFEYVEDVPVEKFRRQIDETWEGSGELVESSGFGEGEEEDVQKKPIEVTFLSSAFVDSLGNDDHGEDGEQSLEVQTEEYEYYEDGTFCEESLFGCCPNSHLPQHGPNGEGCCLSSEQGCCPDFTMTKDKEDSCSCEQGQFGCCPDGVTSKTGPDDDQGCGCKFSEFGCCEDQYTPATGPDYDGCPCKTFDYGCCADGQTVSRGPNGEGCAGCQESHYGCCPDNFTPALSDNGGGCGCAGSFYGCCPDGISEAGGENFEGCDNLPGAACTQPKDGGTGENFTITWFFDLTEGRCLRFYFAGPGGNDNNFPDLENCESVCVNPPGSARCYLPKVAGVCTGNDVRWFYDQKYKQCSSFQYGGCLGNANRFLEKDDCEETCVRTESLSVCEQPLDAGPCRGSFPRWFYNDQTGECDSFTYGGCQGNKNRFVTKEACQNSCYHKKRILEAILVCRQPIATGSCNETEAKWGFDEATRVCRPFYYSGCDGNSNNFPSRQECQAKCPNAFPPELEVINKILNVEEGTEVELKVNLSGNPYPEIYWQHNTVDVGSEDRITIKPDKSLLITRVNMEDSGTWMVTADNGLGKVVRKQISLTVYPSSFPLQVSIPMERTNFEFGSEIEMKCFAEGYPEPQLRWLKNNARLPSSDRIIVQNNTLVIKRASPIDGGAYICRATNKDESAQAYVDLTVEEGSVPLECSDNPKLANCRLVVLAKACTRSEELSRICCESCVMSGQIAGPPVF